ncbi:MAG: hypothetical protein R3B72_48455 [Polyangiaceae bacterium]
MRPSVWALALFAGLATTATHAEADEEEAMHWVYRDEVTHGDPWSICRDYLAKAKDGWCRVRELPFERQGDFHHLWEIRASVDGTTFSTLAVAGPGGVATAHFWWRVDDPDDPGCPSITRSMGLERAWVEDGHLVLVSVGETQAHVDSNPHDPQDFGVRTKLVRGVVVVSWTAEGLQTKDYTMWSGPTYGFKMAPTQAIPSSWDHVPWQARERPKVVEGRLLVSS